jgi:hypothetical protein
MYIKSLGQISGQMLTRQREKSKGFWTGHDTYECPVSILSYSGQLPALLAVNLYMRASVLSIHSTGVYKVRFRARTESLCKKLHRSIPSIRNAFKVLEKDKLAHRERPRDEAKRFETAEITLPYLTSPTRPDLLTANGDRHCIIVPKASLLALNKMRKSSQVAVYQSALSMATTCHSERFDMPRAYWRGMTKLGRHAFDNGLKFCIRKKLLTYRSGIVTLNDPATGKRSIRKPFRPPMPVNFDEITPTGWEQIVSALLSNIPPTGHTGWTAPSKDRSCPYCHEHESFSVNFAQSCFKCHRCGEGSKLCFLVKHVLDADRMFDAALFMKKVLEQQAEIPVEV